MSLHRAFSVAALVLFFLCSEHAFSQLPSNRCDLTHEALERCPYITSNHSLATGDSASSASTNSERSNGGTTAQQLSSSGGSDAPQPIESFVSQPPAKKQGFHWGRALLESFMFLSIEQAYVVHDDYRWVTVENGIPLNHYWRDYKQSLDTWAHSGWNDGDPLLYGYLGHPIQGAFTSFIQIQNDPKGAGLEFSNTKEYWHSRLKATAWNAVYSTQWNIGPLSEMTVEKYGAISVRGPWNQDGTWPCTRKPCYTGVGQIDLVMTPIGGFAWMLGEDLLDKNVARRVESATNNRFLIDVTRCAINPIRGGATILHGRPPWYRARDHRNQ